LINIFAVFMGRNNEKFESQYRVEASENRVPPGFSGLWWLTLSFLKLVL